MASSGSTTAVWETSATCFCTAERVRRFTPSVLRKLVDGPGTDRYLSPEIEHSVQLVKGGDYVEAVEAVVGQLR